MTDKIVEMTIKQLKADADAARRERKGDRVYIAAYKVVPPPTPAAISRETAFYNAGYNEGLEDESPYDPYWGDGPSITPLDELRNETTAEDWAFPIARVAEYYTDGEAAADEDCAFDISDKDYAAYAEGHEAGWKDSWQDHEDQAAEHALLMWQKAG